MRFPSLFRLAKNQQYVVKPRYYDPVKEEIREREAIARKRAESGIDPEDIATKISFKRKTKKAPFASLVQLSIAASLGGLIFGWFEYGNDVLQIYLGGLLVIYLVYRLNKLKGRK